MRDEYVVLVLGKECPVDLMAWIAYSSAERYALNPHGRKAVQCQASNAGKQIKRNASDHCKRVVPNDASKAHPTLQLSTYEPNA